MGIFFSFYFDAIKHVHHFCVMLKLDRITAIVKRVTYLILLRGYNLSCVFGMRKANQC